MRNIKEKCENTTEHIADKILLLRRANKLTQEKFAEKIGIDIRTVARAESGKHRPSAETLEMIADVYNIPISYFYDTSIYKFNVKKQALIYEINSKLNVLSTNSILKIKNIIDILG